MPEWFRFVLGSSKPNRERETWTAAEPAKEATR